MAAISGVSPTTVPSPPTRMGRTDSDGDTDGTKSSKSAAAPAAPVPTVGKPTATLGNNVNTFA